MSEFTRVEMVRAGVEVSMFAENALTPAVIGYNGVLDRTLIIQPSQEYGRVPVPVGSFPLTVRPQNVRSVRIYLLFETPNENKFK